MPITRSIHATAAKHPERPAITTSNRSLTYRELVRESRHTIAAASWLHRKVRLETQPTTRRAASVGAAAVAGRTGSAGKAELAARPVTAVCTASAFAAARIMAALAGTDHIFAAIDPRWPAEHQRNIVLAAGIGVVIVDDTQAATTLRSSLGTDWGGVICTMPEFRNLEHTAATDSGEAGDSTTGDGAAGVADVAERRPDTSRPDSEPFLMLFSSGTTAAPKAFLKTRGQYRANLAVSKRHLGLGPGVVTFAPGPFAYSLTLYAAVETLATGGTIHLASNTDTLTLAGLGERVARENITRIVTVPAMLRGIITQATRTPEQFADLDLIVVGGADLPENLRNELAAVLPHTELISYYGAAEIGFIGQGIPDHPGWHEVYDGVEVQIRSEDGEPMPDGELGTIWVRAASCSDGYVVGGGPMDGGGAGSDNADGSASRLLDEHGWASVGDQGRVRIVDGRQQVQVVGRAGDTINTGGHKVALPEVTRAYAGLTVDGQAFEAVAVGLPDATLGTVLALAVEDSGLGTGGGGARVNPRLTKAALREWGRARLAPQFVPAQYYVVSRIPRTVGGKVKTAELAELLRSGATARTSSEGVQRL
ncbi:fatty acid--CoA ligase family protein [Pseudoglutamicibacter albus]|uniref:class I adenylate-forming enzyme family protein n=1 Tax=Pseudoglutamicibacter albus TaxID=98671 RepID=UPI001EF631DE|nr:fatty acid--CoA ligase family protein [Pseudoglutamicibacter albus]